MVHTVAQAKAGPAATEGQSLFHRGIAPADCYSNSHYARYASMSCGYYHVMRGYAEAAEAAGQPELARLAKIESCDSWGTKARARAAEA